MRRYFRNLRMSLNADDCSMIVDDRLMLGTYVVAVLENAAQHESGDAIDTQPHRRLGKRTQNASCGLVDHMVHAIDKLLDKREIVTGAFVPLGKGNVGLRDGFLQMLEQQVGDVIGIVGQINIAHHKRMLAAVFVDGVADLGPVTSKHTACHGGYAALEDLLCAFAKIGI